VANAFCDESEADTLNQDYLHQIGVAHRLDDWQETAVALELETAA